MVAGVILSLIAGAAIGALSVLAWKDFSKKPPPGPTLQDQLKMAQRNLVFVARDRALELQKVRNEEALLTLRMDAECDAARLQIATLEEEIGECVTSAPKSEPQNSKEAASRMS